jgi:S-methyl-5-thioribose-1-phosphate isomerase
VRVEGRDYRAVWWSNDSINYVDQRLIPYKFEIATASNLEEVEDAIISMGVRGAPTIGVMAAYGLAMAIRAGVDAQVAYDRLLATRPTAVNLKVGLDRIISSNDDPLKSAKDFDDSEVDAAERIGEHGNSVVETNASILTHCNTGWLAAQDWGTAAAVIFKSQRAGKNPFVYVSETRPRLQGSRLTAWEMANESVDHAVIADGASAQLMRQGKVDMVVVGADRIAANGDTANKIGTYAHAVAAKAHGVDFYIAAPVSTIDVTTPSGDQIEIEDRDPDEVLSIRGIAQTGQIETVRIASDRSTAINPAFDVTPADLITGIITDQGIIDPTTEAIASLF